MLSGMLWPAHPHPLPGELLTSWVVRLAEANAIKLQTLSRQLFGPEIIPWSRDIDRMAPEWLISAICAHTSVPLKTAFSLTLASYEGILFHKRQISGQLRWILPVNSRGTKRSGFGMQFCPQCLSEDQVPYFRKAWRVALYTFCPKHNALMQSACINCREPVIIHRRDFGKDLDDAKPIHFCFNCGWDLRHQPMETPELISDQIADVYTAILLQLGDSTLSASEFDLGYMDVLHQMCRLMVSKSRNLLREFVLGEIGREDRAIPKGRFAFETRKVTERYFIISLGIWMLMGFHEKILTAWQNGVIKYNLLLKDFDELPDWYFLTIQPFNRNF